MAKIKAIYKEPGQKADLIEVENDYQSIQKKIGGHFQTFPYITDTDTMLVDEEGKLKKLEPNIGIWNDVIVGPLLICGVDGEELADVTDEAIEQSGWLGLEAAEEVKGGKNGNQ